MTEIDKSIHQLKPRYQNCKDKDVSHIAIQDESMLQIYDWIIALIMSKKKRERIK